MKHSRVFAIALASMALVGGWAEANAQDRSNVPGAYSYAPSRAKARYYKKRPLQVSIYARRRIGGYSHSYADVISTYGTSPPPWADVRQSSGGPFDSGFFFDSGMGLHGGNSPYLR